MAETKSKAKPAVRKTKAGEAPLKVADYLAQQISLCGKTQIKIAQEVGFENPNVITLIKNGKTKIPLDKIGLIAKAVNVDPTHMLRLTLQEYLPSFWLMIDGILKSNNMVTDNEMAIVRILREANNLDPIVPTDQLQEELATVFRKLPSRSQVIANAELAGHSQQTT